MTHKTIIELYKNQSAEISEAVRILQKQHGDEYIRVALEMHIYAMMSDCLPRTLIRDALDNIYSRQLRRLCQLLKLDIDIVSQIAVQLYGYQETFNTEFLQAVSTNKEQDDGAATTADTH